MSNPFAEFLKSASLRIMMEIELKPYPQEVKTELASLALKLLGAANFVEKSTN